MNFPARVREIEISPDDLFLSDGIDGSGCKFENVHVLYVEMTANENDTMRGQTKKSFRGR